MQICYTKYTREKCYLIYEIIFELDFDNSKNRNVNYYFIYFKDGSKVTGIVIKNIFLILKKISFLIKVFA